MARTGLYKTVLITTSDSANNVWEEYHQIPEDDDPVQEQADIAALCQRLAEQQAGE